MAGCATPRAVHPHWAMSRLAAVRTRRWHEHALDLRIPGSARRAARGPQASPRAPAVEHLSVEDRAARGKAARTDVGRSVHGDWAPATGRRDPVELLEDQAKTRLQELVPIRYGRMLVSPFTFYRGAAAVMAADLANEPRTGLDVQLCGDAHLSNFGVFAAPDRRMVFSINDFDETLPGPFEWDVKRLVASFAVAGRDRGFDDKQRHAINLAVTARVPRRDGGLRRACARWSSGTPGSTSRRSPRAGRLKGRARSASASSTTWRRRVRRTACARSASSRTWSTASRGSRATRRSSCRSRTRWRPGSAIGPKRSCTGSSARIAEPCRAIAGACWSASATSIPRARSSGWEASGRARGSSCCSAATTRTRCCCRPRRRRRRCSSRRSAPARSPTTASASSRASG